MWAFLDNINLTVYRILHNQTAYFPEWNTTFYLWNDTYYVSGGWNESIYNLNTNFSTVWEYFNCAGLGSGNEICNYLSRISNNQTAYFPEWNTTFYLWNDTYYTILNDLIMNLSENWQTLWNHFNCSYSGYSICDYLSEINQTTKDMYSYLQIILKPRIDSIYIDTQIILSKWGIYTASDIINKLDLIISDAQDIQNSISNLSVDMKNNFSSISLEVNYIKDNLESLKSELGYHGKTITAYAHIKGIVEDLEKLNQTVSATEESTLQLTGKVTALSLTTSSAIVILILIILTFSSVVIYLRKPELFMGIKTKLKRKPKRKSYWLD